MRLYNKRNKKNFTNALTKEQKIALYKGISSAKQHATGSDRERVDFNLTGEVSKGEIEKLITAWSLNDGFDKVCNGSKTQATIKFSDSGCAGLYADQTNNHLAGDWKNTYDAAVKEAEEEEELRIEEEERAIEDAKEEKQQILDAINGEGEGNSESIFGGNLITIIIIGCFVLAGIYFFID